MIFKWPLFLLTGLPILQFLPYQSFCIEAEIRKCFLLLFLFFKPSVFPVPLPEEMFVKESLTHPKCHLLLVHVSPASVHIDTVESLINCIRN